MQQKCACVRACVRARARARARVCVCVCVCVCLFISKIESCIGANTVAHIQRCAKEKYLNSYEKLVFYFIITDKLTEVDEKTDEGAISIRNILDACGDGNIETFLFHLKSEIGERKKLLERPDENGWNVLHYAAKGSNLKIFEELLSENIVICQKTNEQLTVLHIASKYGNIYISRCILENEQFTSYHNAVSLKGKNACPC